MEVLLVHNQYQQHGGEDEVFRAEVSLLEAYGHRVLQYGVHNDQVANLNPVGLAATTVWNRSSYHQLRALIREERPKVAHFHNTFPLLSPAVYYAAGAERVPVVQTLHNYRLLCPNALFFRDGHVCEDCRAKFLPWPGVLHACYRRSRPASGAVAAMITAHRVLRTWARKIDAYVALTDFARQKFIQGGVPAERISVKPNFLHPDPGKGRGEGGYALFVGRLSVEKGIDSLLEAWKRLEGRMPLKIVGDGPLGGKVAAAAQGLRGVEWLGRRPKERVLSLMSEARLLVVPSECYENFPLSIVEAFGLGLPVIASDLGSVASLVDHGRTGLRFRPGDAADLAAKVVWTLDYPVRFADMRSAARDEFETKYTAEENYRQLMSIYESAARMARV